jgi:hypothetical protein
VNLLRCFALLLAAPLVAGEASLPEKAEFHFLRLEYRDAPFVRRNWNRGWWMQDMPEAEMHFSRGIERLSRVHLGNIRHAPLTDDRVLEYPWIYATQVGFWDLSAAETERLRNYLLRGGFLVVDDFHGEDDWQRFAATMERVLPGHAIEEIEDDNPVMNLVFQIHERTFIPGLRHLRRGPNGTTTVQPTAIPPTWRAIYDDQRHMIVAINFNMDIGDAWEHADMPEYPEAMTSLSYRFGINYILYAFTH